MSSYSSPWGHDYAWEREIVRRIRDGGRAPEAYALYEGAISHETPERGGLLTGVVYYDEAEAAERAARSREFRESANQTAQEAASASKRRRSSGKERYKPSCAALSAPQRKEERAREACEVGQGSRRAARGLQTNRPIEIAERIEHANQENRIMLSRWVCTVCQGNSIIERKNPGYQIQCTSCGKQAWGSHASLWKVLNQ